MLSIKTAGLLNTCSKFYIIFGVISHNMHWSNEQQDEEQIIVCNNNNTHTQIILHVCVCWESWVRERGRHKDMYIFYPIRGNIIPSLTSTIIGKSYGQIAHDPIKGIDTHAVMKWQFNKSFTSNEKLTSCVTPV